MKKLEGKVAIVTGASRGIGASIARAYASEGAKVVVNYASSMDAAERIVGAIRAEGGQAIAVQADVSKAADVKRLFEETKKAYDHLDVLVNNAAVFSFAPIEALTEEEFQRQFGTNVLGPLLTSREALKYFGKEGGSILNIGTVASQERMPMSSVYAASKGALDSLSRVLSAELGPRKIRVNTLSPGPVETEGFLAMGAAGEELKKNFIPRVALGRIGQPADIASVAVFFASEDSAWVTGETLRVSGGFS